MNTNWCVFKEISMEIGMINFLNDIIGHCTDQRNLLYWNTIGLGWIFPTLLTQMIKGEKYVPHLIEMSPFLLVPVLQKMLPKSNVLD